MYLPRMSQKRGLYIPHKRVQRVKKTRLFYCLNVAFNFTTFPYDDYYQVFNKKLGGQSLGYLMTVPTMYNEKLVPHK